MKKYTLNTTPELYFLADHAEIIVEDYIVRLYITVDDSTFFFDIATDEADLYKNGELICDSEKLLDEYNEAHP